MTSDIIELGNVPSDICSKLAQAAGIFRLTNFGDMPDLNWAADNYWHDHKTGVTSPVTDEQREIRNNA